MAPLLVLGMTAWAIRWFVVGVVFASLLHLIVNPPIGVVLAALMVGYVIGSFVYCVDAFLCWIFGDK